MESLQETCSEAVKRAIRFLATCQRPNGGWPPDKPQDPSSSCWTTGHVLWGLTRTREQVDKNLIEAGMNYLASCQKKDGSWCSEFHRENEVIPTSLAIIALSESAEHELQLKKAISRLKKLQNEDGGFGITVNDGSRVRSTVFSLLALIRLYEKRTITEEKPFIINDVTNWLVRAQNADGGWGEQYKDAQNNVTCTAKSVLCLARALTNGLEVDYKSLEKGAEWLAGHQLINGGWEGWDQRYTDNPKLQDLFIEGLDTTIVVLALAEALVMMCEKCKRGETDIHLCSRILESLYRGTIRLVEAQSKEGGWILEKDRLKPDKSNIPRVWAVPYLIQSLEGAAATLSSICNEGKTLLTRLNLEEVQASLSTIPLGVRRVGVTKVKEQITIFEDKEIFNTVGNFDIYIDLIPLQKGIHMSRSIASLRKVLKEAKTHRWNLSSLCLEIARECLRQHGKYANVAEVYAAVDLPFPKRTPISNLDTYEIYDVHAWARATLEDARKSVGVTVVGLTACPSGAKSLREANKTRLVQNLGINPEQADRIVKTILGATHSQRARATLDVEIPERYDIKTKELVKIVEDSIGSPTYELLKRDDEASVIMRSHENPRFVEDCVRIIAERALQKLGNLPRATVTIRVETEESIHKHNAIAELRNMTFDRLKVEIQRWRGARIVDYY